MLAVPHFGATKLFHHLVAPKQTYQDHNRNAHFCHCLNFNYLAKYGTTMEEVQESLKWFIKSLPPPISFMSHGTDMTLEAMQTMFPGIDWAAAGSVVPIPFPRWAGRDGKHYHTAALNAKTNGKIAGFDLLRRLPCHLSIAHSLKFYSAKKTSELKKKYGYHCAAIDAIELALYNFTAEARLQNIEVHHNGVTCN